MYYSIKTKGRNITGIAPNTRETAQQTPSTNYSGAFYVASLTQWPNSSPDKMSNIWRGDLGFDASRVVPTASDNHPYSMYFVPLITY